MKISVLSVFPQLYDSFLSTSLLKRAQQNNLVSVETDTFFSFVAPKQRIDAPSFGPGAGMLIKPEVVEAAIDHHERAKGRALKIFFSPQGKKLDQGYLRTIADKALSLGHVMLVPARYEGMDARVEQEYADELVSVGDFVLMSGDLPAMIFIEALLRLVPGVVGKQESVEKESFSGPFVDYPEYTEPVEWHGHTVPEIVRSGNHAAIEAWREQQAIKKTVVHHFDWLRSYPMLSDKEKKRVQENLPPHYVALCHSNVYVGEGEHKVEGTTSVTSIDIHDIARSCKTYAVEGYSIVTPLLDQQRIVKTLLDFWHVGHGLEYNKSRHDALKSVGLSATIEEVVEQITQKHGKKPLVIATSARTELSVPRLSFYDQGEIWSQDRPVLLAFGTGKGFTREFLERCDYLLMPVEGFSGFNHLSVRSAVAIILDRWMGINKKKTL